jgi:hypothetical protein
MVTCGRPEGNGVEGHLAVVGGWVLRREDVRRSRGAQHGVDEAGGGPAWAGVAQLR